MPTTRTPPRLGAACPPMPFDRSGPATLPPGRFGPDEAGLRITTVGDRPPAMGLASSWPAGAFGLSVGGELDLESIPALHAAAAGAYRHAPVGGVIFVLDLAQVTFMDSAAIGALAEIQAQVRGRGWRLCLTPPDARTPRWLLLLAAREGWLPR